MLYREIIAICSEIHTEHINTLCGLNVETETPNPVVRTVIIRLSGLKRLATGSGS